VAARAALPPGRTRRRPVRPGKPWTCCTPTCWPACAGWRCRRERRRRGGFFFAPPGRRDRGERDRAARPPGASPPPTQHTSERAARAVCLSSGPPCLMSEASPPAATGPTVPPASEAGLQKVGRRAMAVAWVGSGSVLRAREKRAFACAREANAAPLFVPPPPASHVADAPGISDASRLGACDSPAIYPVSAPMGGAGRTGGAPRRGARRAQLPGTVPALSERRESVRVRDPALPASPPPTRTPQPALTPAHGSG